MTLVDLAEEPGFIFPTLIYTHIVTHNHPLPQFQGMPTGMHVGHILECKQKDSYA